MYPNPQDAVPLTRGGEDAASPGGRIDAIDGTWKAPPLTWALTGWQRSGHAGQYSDVVAALVAAGASATSDIKQWDKVQADPKMVAALEGVPTERRT